MAAGRIFHSNRNRLHKYIGILLILLVVTACQPATLPHNESPIPQANDKPTQVYRFQANADTPTTLQFHASRADNPFVAQLWNAKGDMIASINSGILQRCHIDRRCWT